MFRLVSLLMCWVCLFGNVSAGEAPSSVSLMPIPENIVFTGLAFRVDTSFRIVIQGNAHERLYSGATIQGGLKGDVGWEKDALEAIEKAQEPRGETELMILLAIEKLVARARGNIPTK